MNIRVKSSVKINRQKVKEITQQALTSLEQTAEATRTELINKQYMPFDNGTLQNENTFVDDSEIKNGTIKIVSSTPYARRLYFHPEYDFQTVNNANAQGEWFEPFISGADKDFITDTFKKIMRKNTK
jgi:hypothetical protein